MTVRRIGTWKDSTRRMLDAAIAGLLPGGFSLLGPLAWVDGYLYPHEAVFLYHLARDGPGKGTVVEIGSFRGRSTLCLAIGLRRRGEGIVHAVDPHVYGTEAELRENLIHFRVLNQAEMVVASSVEVAAGWTLPVRLLFIDGNHEEQSVQADLDAWLPHVEPGGFVLLHDSTTLSGFPGPLRVAGKVLKVGGVFETTGSIGSISWARRRGGGVWVPAEFGKRWIDGLIAWRASPGCKG